MRLTVGDYGDDPMMGNVALVLCAKRSYEQRKWQKEKLPGGEGGRSAWRCMNCLLIDDQIINHCNCWPDHQ